jgi:hypothetical protein
MNMTKSRFLKPFNFIITLKVKSLLREFNPNLKKDFAHVQQRLAPTTTNPTPKFQPQVQDYKNKPKSCTSANYTMHIKTLKHDQIASSKTNLTNK